MEVPVWASKKGLEAVRVGALPAQCAMLTGLSAQVEEMAVEGALTGDPRLVYQAIVHDPLTAAVLIDGGSQRNGQLHVRTEQGVPSAVLTIESIAAKNNLRVID